MATMNAWALEQEGHTLPAPCVSCRNQDADPLFCAVCLHDPDNQLVGQNAEVSARTSAAPVYRPAGIPDPLGLFQVVVVDRLAFPIPTVATSPLSRALEIADSYSRACSRDVSAVFVVAVTGPVGWNGPPGGYTLEGLFRQTVPADMPF